MAKITAIQTNKITDEYTKIAASWAKIASDVTREADLLMQFAAFKNFHYLNGGSYFDEDDITSINNNFNTVFAVLQVQMGKLADLSAIPNADLAVYETNNNKFIVDKGIDLDTFSKRYQA